MTAETATKVVLSSEGLVLPGGEAQPLWSGALHYFRTSPAHWERALREAAALGFRIVESYVPWGVHEVAPRQHRFSGQYDLGRFLDLCQEHGLLVILRPGPHINAELPFFGFPERIVRDPALCMRNSSGQPLFVPLPPRMFPAPSYAAARFHTEVAAWYAAVAQVVAPRLHPRGPVVALQVDNEQPLFFRTGAYDGDYHEEALAAWQSWQSGQGLEVLAAPRRFPSDVQGPGGLAVHLRWLAFKEALCVTVLEQLAGALKAAGLNGVPLFHNFPPADPGPFDVARTEGVLDCAGIDMYHRRSDYGRVRRRALYLLGSSRYPYVPEMGAGSFPWGPPLRDEDSQATLLCALAHGVRGFNLYMLVERDRWYGAPLSESGHPHQERAGFYRQVLGSLREAGGAGLRAAASIGVLLPREYQRLTLCASHLGPMSPMWLDWFGWSAEAAGRRETFGLKDAVQQAFPRRREALLGALEALHRSYALVDASAGEDLLAQRQALIVPTYEFLSRALAERLRRYVAAGGVLLLGPRLPVLDEDFAPCDHGLDGPGVHLLPEAEGAGLMEPLREALPVAPEFEAAYRFDPPQGQGAGQSPMQVMVHGDRDGQVRLIGAGNPAAEPVRGRLSTPGRVVLRDAVTGERWEAQAGAEIDFGPHQTRLLVRE